MQKRSQRLWPFMTKIRGRTLSKKFLLTVSRDLGEALYIFWLKVKIKMTYFIFLNSYSQNKLYLYKFTINRIKNIQALKAIKLDYSVTSLITRSLRL